jgi:hypothetical protein
MYFSLRLRVKNKEILFKNQQSQDYPFFVGELGFGNSLAMTKPVGEGF